MTSCVIFLDVRASRLLHILLLLQNRGRLTSIQLARELEVTRRTILRDIDALTEAGLPMLVHQGHRGGIELGFGYRTKLTGLSADESEAIGVTLWAADNTLTALGMADAANRARRKLVESFPDHVRERALMGAQRFRAAPHTPTDCDPRLPALATAIRQSRIVRIRAFRPDEQVVHPVALAYTGTGWSLDDGLTGTAVPLDTCGDINISSRTFGSQNSSTDVESHLPKGSPSSVASKTRAARTTAERTPW